MESNQVSAPHGGPSGRKGPPGRKDFVGVHHTGKVKTVYIPEKVKRQNAFHKRKEGIFKKAKELHHMTGAEVMLEITSESGRSENFVMDKKKNKFEKINAPCGGVNKNTLQSTSSQTDAIEEGSNPPAPNVEANNHSNDPSSRCSSTCICIMEERDTDKITWIQCEHCGTWCHDLCFGFSLKKISKQAKLKTRFYCLEHRHHLREGN